MTVVKGFITVNDKDDNIMTDSNGFTCGCGNPRLKIKSKFKGIKEYGTSYQCECGNVLAVVHKRSFIQRI